MTITEYDREPALKRRRPWKVHVRDIGPTYSFATEAAARERAQALVDGEFVLGKNLVGGWGEVHVYDDRAYPVRRWIYRPAGVEEEAFAKGGDGRWRWYAVES